jgi:hypothetical protein
MAGRDSSSPRGEAVVLTSLGAALTLYEALEDLFTGRVACGLGSQICNSALVAGIAAVILVIALAVLIVAYHMDAEGGSFWGTGVIVAGAFTLWVGGGYIVGAILSVVGGVLTVVLPVQKEARQDVKD